MYLAEIRVFSRSHRATTGVLEAGRQRFVCALGRSGLSARKREGDGTTPMGRFYLRRLLFRHDRLPRPRCGLPMEVLTPATAWCEDPVDVNYNRQVTAGPAGGIDRMWREDHLYDVVIEMGYNDCPVIKGKGSAVFLHLARPGYAPTAGCVALSARDMMHLLPRLGPRTHIRIG